MNQQPEELTTSPQVDKLNFSYANSGLVQYIFDALQYSGDQDSDEQQHQQQIKELKVLLLMVMTQEIDPENGPEYGNILIESDLPVAYEWPRQALPEEIISKASLQESKAGQFFLTIEDRSLSRLNVLDRVRSLFKGKSERFRAITAKLHGRQKEIDTVLHHHFETEQIKEILHRDILSNTINYLMEEINGYQGRAAENTGSVLFDRGDQSVETLRQMVMELFNELSQLLKKMFPYQTIDLPTELQFTFYSSSNQLHVIKREARWMTGPPVFSLPGLNRSQYLDRLDSLTSELTTYYTFSTEDGDQVFKATLSLGHSSVVELQTGEISTISAPEMSVVVEPQVDDTKLLPVEAMVAFLSQFTGVPEIAIKRRGF